LLKDVNLAFSTIESEHGQNGAVQWDYEVAILMSILPVCMEREYGFDDEANGLFCAP
jgi:hypothetical protein